MLEKIKKGHFIGKIEQKLFFGKSSPTTPKPFQKIDADANCAKPPCQCCSQLTNNNQLKTPPVGAGCSGPPAHVHASTTIIDLFFPYKII